MIKHSTWTRLGDRVSIVGQWAVVVVALLVAAAVLAALLSALGSLAWLLLLDLIGGSMTGDDLIIVALAAVGWLLAALAFAVGFHRARRALNGHKRVPDDDVERLAREMFPDGFASTEAGER